MHDAKDEIIYVGKASAKEPGAPVFSEQPR